MTTFAYVLSPSLGAVATAVAIAVTPFLLTGPRHRRTNYRGREVFATMGIVLLKPLTIGVIASILLGRHERVPLTMLAGGAAMGVLGYIDDAYGDRHAGGLIGHARALLGGRITTGMLKAAGGAGVGLASAYVVGWRGIWIAGAGAVVALASNLTNLLDLRPGRALKVFVLAAAASIAVGVHGGGALVLATLLAGAAVFAVPELREQVMLGDTGANLLGTTLGIAVVASVGTTALLIVLAVLGALTLLSERISFTRVIEATPPLRWFDDLGRVGGGP
jgi:UDP-N-acetylmuramyl pentapeptide phosphotransferase/UDP-N-acetylglucosamine-1-phosphate transferase